MAKSASRNMAFLTDNDEQTPKELSRMTKEDSIGLFMVDGMSRWKSSTEIFYKQRFAIIDFKLHIPDCDTVYVQAGAKRILGHLDQPKTEDRRFEVVERRRLLVSLAIYLANKVNWIASKIAALQRGIVDDDYSQAPDTFAAGNVANLDDAVNLDSALQAPRELEQGNSLIELDQIHKDCFSEMTKPIVNRVELYRAVPNASAMALSQSNSPDIPCQQQKCV